jgi:hypothetical protein
MTNAEEWAEIRRLHWVEGLSKRGVSGRFGLTREKLARALHPKAPPSYRRMAMPSKSDPFKVRIGKLLGKYPRLSAVRVPVTLGQEGLSRGMTILRLYLQQVQPRRVQTFRRMAYPPGEIGQVDPDPWAQPAPSARAPRADCRSGPRNLW